MTDETNSVKSGSLAGTSTSNGTKKRRGNEVKYYAVRVGHQPGVYHTWADCLEQVKGFKKATCKSERKAQHFSKTNGAVIVKSFSTLHDAERFVVGENPPQSGSHGLSPPTKFYAVKSGRVPGIYMDWVSAQEQIKGWQKPKHRCFTTRVEAQGFLNEDETPGADTASIVDGDSGTSALYHASEGQIESDNQPPPQKKAKLNISGTRGAMAEFSDANLEPGVGPLPPGAEDDFDPNVMLDPQTGKIVYKTQEQRQATKSRPSTGLQTEPIRVHTDGSSLGNGRTNAFAGVGVYFGPGDKRYFQGNALHVRHH